MCLAVAQILDHSGSASSHFLPLGVFFIEVWTLTWLQGASAGQRILRFKVVRIADGGRPSAMQCLIRTFLLCLVVTAVTFDENGRGLHERLSGTVLSA
jgi:hypothetical protein